LHAATFRLTAPSRVRMLLSPSGAIAIESRRLPAPPEGPVSVAILPLPVDPDDFRLRHKTTDRAFYDDARKAAGTFEVVFERADGFLTEGSFTSLFVERDEKLVTPPLSDGLLPGILRRNLLDGGLAVEQRLTRADLAEGFVIGNAARGLMPAKLQP
jgi:para-aminobenzoate synthetase/4-amino-4-deoxychorismate lyase